MVTRGRPRSFDVEQALRVAMRAFWERGYEATSISSLAEAMGIKAQSLYTAFGDKEQLFRSALRLYGENEGSIARRALERNDTAYGAVEAMLRESVDRFTDSSMPCGCMVVLSATNTSEVNDVVADHVADLRRADEQSLRDRLAEGIASGEIRDDVDPDRLAGYYHTVLYGLSVQARDGSSRARLHGIVDLALAMWPSGGRDSR